MRRPCPAAARCRSTRARQYLAALGIAIPQGGLARDVAEAKAIAQRIGYPVALKAQAAALAHKSDAGGVALNIADDAALDAAWQEMQARLAKAQPGLALDGILVEAMAAKGVEMIVGARRDPDWGPVVLVGLGGIWTEALDDVRLMPADLSREQIMAEINKLKGARLLHGLRGAPPVDVAAVADVVIRVARADARAAGNPRDRHQSADRLSAGRAGARCADRRRLARLASAARFCWIDCDSLGRRRMVPFFVQIKCHLGKSYQVANALADAEIASEIYSTAGDFDLLVKFYVEDATDIGHFINEKVQVIPGIQDTRTIITFKAFG